MGETEMLAGRAPFLWGGGGREAVLCIHGFTGSPGIFRKLGRALNNDGFCVYAPVLPGHGTVPEDLAAVTERQLTAAVERAYTSLNRTYERVHVVGLSLGGTLATLLAANHAGESGLGSLTLLSPGYGFNSALAARLGLDHWTDQPENRGKAIPIPQRKPQNDEMDECIFGYNAAPLSIFGPVMSLNKAARDVLLKVTAPVLLLYAEKDAVVDAGAYSKAAGLLPNLEEVQGFAESEHNLLLGCDREETMARCRAFLQRHRLKSGD